MDEKSIMLYVAILIGYVLSFICGWLGSKYHNLKTGLGSNSESCDSIESDLKRDADRIADNQDRLGECIDEGERIEKLFRQYSDTTNEEQKSE